MFTSKTLKATAAIFGATILACTAQTRTVATENNAIKFRPTHESLLDRQKPVRKADERREVTREEVLKTAHRKARQQRGLISRSSTLSSSSSWSLVPNGAILHVPEIYKKRVNDTRSGKLVGWQDFYNQNRRWIRTVSITIEQASGKDPLTPEYLQSLKQGGQVLVAVCRGGPISVILPETAEEPAEELDPEAAASEARKAQEKERLEAQALERLKRRLLQRN